MLYNMYIKHKCKDTHTFPHIWHRSLHLVSDPGLQGSPLDAHRKGGMSAPSFRINYDTRDKLWLIMLQNVTFPGKPMTTLRR